MAVVQLAKGAYRIPVAPADLLNVFALVDEAGRITLVDSGGKRAIRRIATALRRIGHDLSAVTRVVLTHGHPDHAAGLRGLVEATGATVAVHERDAIYVRTGTPPRRDRSFASGRLFDRVAPGWTATNVDQELADGDVLDAAGTLRVVHTPGHTPGHVSLLHEPSGVLLTGDAVFHVRGLRYAPTLFCTDARLTRDTADRLTGLNFDVVAFSHGPEIRRGAREALRAFVGERSG